MLSPLFSTVPLSPMPSMGGLPTLEPQEDGDAFGKALQRAHEAARPPAPEPALGAMETNGSESDTAEADAAQRSEDDEDHDDDAKAEKAREPADLAAWMAQWMGPRAVPGQGGRSASEDSLRDAQGTRALKGLTGRRGQDGLAGADSDGLSADANFTGLDGDTSASGAATGTTKAAAAGRSGSDRLARGALGRGTRAAAEAASVADGARAAEVRAGDMRRDDALALPAAASPRGEGFAEGSGVASPFAPSAALLAPTSGTAGFQTLLHEGAAPASLHTAIAAPLDSPEFAPALGLQVAVMARDGIEQARVQLHPAEMGPIELKLALEGTQVRVDLLADLGATRQVLEQALPDLAGALREAGFTLTGGGVFQQSPREGSAPRESDPWPTRAVGRRAGVGALESAGEARTDIRARVSRGLVDTFA